MFKKLNKKTKNDIVNAPVMTMVGSAPEGPYHARVREDVVSDHHLAEGSLAYKPTDDVTVVHDVARRTAVTGRLRG